MARLVYGGNYEPIQRFKFCRYNGSFVLFKKITETTVERSEKDKRNTDNIVKVALCIEVVGAQHFQNSFGS